MAKIRWEGEWYQRRKAGDWRNRRTGAVSRTPRGSFIQAEPIGRHISGRDKKIIRAGGFKTKTELTAIGNRKRRKR